MFTVLAPSWSLYEIVRTPTISYTSSQFMERETGWKEVTGWSYVSGGAFYPLSEGFVTSVAFWYLGADNFPPRIYYEMR